MNLIEDILLAFIPMFVAVDAIGVLPIFASLTDGMQQQAKNRIIAESMITALCLTAAFVFVGKLVFRLLAITMGDFMIAGGAILFCLAILDVVSPTKKRRVPGDELGIVPLGTPLIAGPAVLTTSILLVSQYGFLPTLVSLIANIGLAGLMLRSSFLLTRWLGAAGEKALSKVTSLLLAAIAVMLIRRGLEHFLIKP